MISIKEFIANEKALHEESLRKRDISFNEFEEKLKAEEADDNDINKFTQSISEFLDAEELQAKRFAEKMATLKVS